MTATPFILDPWGIPDFPSSLKWADHLRWCVAVMDGDDADLGFAASLLSHALKGGLTEKQARYAQRVIDRVRAHHSSGLLDCQQDRPLVPGAPSLGDNVVPLRQGEGS